MSDTDAGAPKAPKAVIEQASVQEADASEAAAREAAAEAQGKAAAGKHGKGAKRAKGARATTFQDATIGFFQGLGRAAWSYADAHPHATLYGLIGFVLAVLILVIGLWDTIVIAVFVAVGTIIGQMVDGDNAIVNFFSRLFGGRR